MPASDSKMSFSVGLLSMGLISSYLVYLGLDIVLFTGLQAMHTINF